MLLNVGRYEALAIISLFVVYCNFNDVAADAPPLTACQAAVEASRRPVRLLGHYVPQCDENGEFVPLQVHGSTGYSWCVDRHGNVIAGTRRPPGHAVSSCPTNDAVDKPHLTQCQAEVEAYQRPVGYVGHYVPQCEENGDYKPLQVYGSTGYSWCVDRYGNEVPETRRPPGHSISACSTPAGDVVCPNDLVRCPSGLKQCVLPQWVCDGDIDCPDGSDEDRCD